MPPWRGDASWARWRACKSEWPPAARAAQARRASERNFPLSAFSLLYVSRSVVRGPAAEIAVADIVSVSRQRNLGLRVCGALLFTGTRFAQVLEGPRAGVDELMDSITRDSRHTDIVIIEQGDIHRRRFATWALAYCGPSAFVAQAVERALDEAARPRMPAKGEALIRLLKEFSSKSSDEAGQ